MDCVWVIYLYLLIVKVNLIQKCKVMISLQLSAFTVSLQALAGLLSTDSLASLSLIQSDYRGDPLIDRGSLRQSACLTAIFQPAV